ncbi:MAG: tRNA (N6-threonylcarbamoyladenosine(37)-N6)-methyltransferase TrmO [bacterium]
METGNKKIEFNYIGIINTPFINLENMPIQPKASEAIGKITIFDEYIEGFDSVSLFSHLFLLYHFHQIQQKKIKVKPFLDNKERGIFATRAPSRPNPIGLSIVRLLEVKGNELIVGNVDMLDGTPLLDIKPYVPRFDIFQDANNGWLPDDVDLKNIKSDTRF